MKILAIGLGSFIGANLRYWLQSALAARWGTDFPHGTLLINITGSFVLGLFVTLIATRWVVSPNVRLFVAVGLLGGYTTFSSFTVETLTLLQGGRWLYGALYLFGNVVVGLIAALGGMALARAL